MSNNNTIYGIYHNSCNFFEGYYHDFDLYEYLLYVIIFYDIMIFTYYVNIVFMKVENRPVIAFQKNDQKFYESAKLNDISPFFLLP
jgi:hypothetical protein